LFRSQGITGLVLCVGYLGHLVEEHLADGREFGVSIRYSYEQGRLMGTAGAIKQAEDLLEDVFLVQYGDSYLPIDYPAVVKHFQKHDRLGLMVVYKIMSR
jgi:NDP-sugar pyrophosphorylase family protein